MQRAFDEVARGRTTLVIEDGEACSSESHSAPFAVEFVAFDDASVATLAIDDPVLYYSCPIDYTAQCGFDVLAHASERILFAEHLEGEGAQIQERAGAMGVIVETPASPSNL